MTSAAITELPATARFSVRIDAELKMAWSAMSELSPFLSSTPTH
jgi:hypothetical protein